MITDNFCFYLQNRLIQTGQTGGQLYSDTSPFSIPWSGGSSPEQRVSKIIDRANRTSLVRGNDPA
jgi:hypothetical protein